MARQDADIGFVVGIEGFNAYKKQVAGIGKLTEDAAKKGQKGVNDLGASFKRIPATLKGIKGSIDSTFAVQKIQEFARAFKDVGLESLRLADVQARAERKVEQAIKQTNGAALRSLKQLKTAANELQKTTLFGDEDILANASAQLLTFTNIAGDQFDRVTKVALDLATVLDSELRPISIQLGKALNDLSGQGVAALQRSGIQFTKSQKELIKSLFATNQVAEAQNIILTELENQYGGQAVAAAAASDGLKQFQNRVGDLKEEIGRELRPALKAIIGNLDGLLGFLGENRKAIIAAAVAIGTLAAGITVATVAMKIFTLVSATNPFVLIATGIAAAAVAIAVFIAIAPRATKSVLTLGDAAKVATSGFRNLAERMRQVALASGVLSGLPDILTDIATGASNGAEGMRNLQKELADVNAEIAAQQIITEPSTPADASFITEAATLTTEEILNRIRTGLGAAAKATAQIILLTRRRGKILEGLTAITGAQEKAAEDAAKQIDFVTGSLKDLNNQLSILKDLQNKSVVLGTGQWAAYAFRVAVAKQRIDDLTKGIEKIAPLTATVPSALPTTETRNIPTVAITPGTAVDITFLERFNALLDEIGESTRALALTISQELGGAFGTLAADLGRAIGAGEGFMAAIQAFIRTLLVQIPRMVGMFLINAGVQLSFAPGGFLVGLPFILAGLGLTGLSGLAGGLLSRLGPDEGDVSLGGDVAGRVSSGLSSFRDNAFGGLSNQINIQVFLGNEEFEDAIVRVVSDDRTLRGG